MGPRKKTSVKISAHVLERARAQAERERMTLSCWMRRELDDAARRLFSGGDPVREPRSFAATAECAASWSRSAARAGVTRASWASAAVRFALDTCGAPAPRGPTPEPPQRHAALARNPARLEAQALRYERDKARRLAREQAREQAPQHPAHMTL